MLKQFLCCFLLAKIIDDGWLLLTPTKPKQSSSTPTTTTISSDLPHLVGKRNQILLLLLLLNVLFVGGCLIIVHCLLLYLNPGLPYVWLLLALSLFSSHYAHYWSHHPPQFKWIILGLRLSEILVLSLMLCQLINF